MAYDLLSEATPRVVFVGSGTRGPFTFSDGGTPIRVRTSSFLVVKRYSSTADEDGTQLTLNTDYTVNNTDADNVTITLTTAQAVLVSTQRLVVERTQPVQGVIEYSSAGNFSGPTLSDAISVHSEQIQELRRDVDRAIKVDWRETDELALPLPPTLTAKYLQRDTDGTIIQTDAAPTAAIDDNNLVANEWSATGDGTTTTFTRTGIGASTAAHLDISFDGIGPQPWDEYEVGLSGTTTTIVFDTAPASGVVIWFRPRVYQGLEGPSGTPADMDSYTTLSGGTGAETHWVRTAGSLNRKVTSNNLPVTATSDSTARTLADWFARLAGTAGNQPLIILGEGLSPSLITARLPDFVGGTRGPLFIWNDPADADLVAGQAAALQLWVGENPTGTPGAGDAVALSIITINGNNRDALWAGNFVTSFANAGTGYVNGMGRALEAEILSDFAFTESDPWGAGNRKNGIEIVGAAATGGKYTAALTTWVNDSTGTRWFDTGIGISRVASQGILFAKNPGGTSDSGSAFTVAAIYDKSDSASVVKVDGTHTNLIDLAGLTALTKFILGDSNAATVLPIDNDADYALTMVLDAGSSAAQQTQIRFDDRGTNKFGILKTSANVLAIYNYALSATAFAVNASSQVAFANDVIIGTGTPSANAIGLGRALTIYNPSGAGGIVFDFNGAIRGYMTGDTGYLQLLTNGSVPLKFGVNGAVQMSIDASGNKLLGTAALATNATTGFVYLPSSAGTPTGVPTAVTGMVPLHYDTTNNKIYVYNGAWKATAALT